MSPTGTQRYTTTDLAVGISGAPVVIYNIIVRGGGTATVVNLRHGTVATDAIVDIINAGIDTTVARNYGTSGLHLPSGAFLDVDANTTFATVSYAQVRSV